MNCAASALFIQQRRKIYCCNCGKLGHVLRNCLEPIISLGIILFHRNNSTIRFLMIRRKFSLGFMDFISGKYGVDNLEYIYRIFNEMTIHEKLRIMNEPFYNLWYSVDYNQLDTSYPITDDIRKKIDIDYAISIHKYNLLKHGFINSQNVYVNLYQIINNCKHNWLEQEWEFPKGKRKMNESNLDAAIREFQEETNYSEDNFVVYITEHPTIEKYTGSNNKKYKHIYYLGRTDKMKDYEKNELTTDQDVEISCIRWMTYQEAIQSIRPYQIEKKMALTHIYSQITTHNL